MMPSDFQFRIYGWMINKYGLKGNDLIVFAYLHYYTVCNVVPGCFQTRAEIAERLDMSVYMVNKVMESLYLNGLAKKERVLIGAEFDMAYRTTVEEKGYEKA